MFAKLLKRELRSTLTTMWVMSLGVFGASIVGAVILRILFNYSAQMRDSDSALRMLPTVLGLAFGAVILALVVYGVGGSLFVLYRFYQNKFTDEGYLTFTLPVSAHQHLLSSWVSVMIGYAMIGMTLSVSIFCLFVFGTAEQGLWNWEMAERLVNLFPNILRSVWDELKDTTGPVLIWYYVAETVQLLTSPLITIASIVLGASVAKKHKLLAAIGFNYLISAVTEIVIPLFSIIVALFTNLRKGGIAVVEVSMYLQPVCYLALAVGAYFLSVRMMSRKLNLP